jgi:hypothetical protein
MSKPTAGKNPLMGCYAIKFAFTQDDNDRENCHARMRDLQEDYGDLRTLLLQNATADNTGQNRTIFTKRISLLGGLLTPVGDAAQPLPFCYAIAKAGTFEFIRFEGNE